MLGIDSKWCFMVLLALVGLKIGERDAQASEVDLDWFTTVHECKEGMSREECNTARSNARAQAKRDAEAGKQVTRDDRDCRNKVVESQVGLYGIYPQFQIKTQRVCEGHNPMIDGAYGQVPMSEVKQNPWLANGQVPMTGPNGAFILAPGQTVSTPNGNWSLSAIMDDVESVSRRNRELALTLAASRDVAGDLAYEASTAKAERDEALNALEAVVAERR